MTDEQKKEIYQVLKLTRLENLDIKRDGRGKECLHVVLSARPCVSIGDWKKNVESALRDMVVAAVDAHDRFIKATS